MAKSFYSKSEYTLAGLLDKATHNATVFVPDLQRPYVWTPNQVSLLVDSLFRGWPFGTLLTWTVSLDTVDGQLREGIPFRSFYTLVSKAEECQSSKDATKRTPHYATVDTMVLDGQQRVQSLILALGDADGICMHDSEWERCLDPSSRARSKYGHTTGALCLDLEKFLVEMRRCNHLCRNVELAKCLRWAVTNQALCSTWHRGGKPPIPVAYANDGVFIPLRRLWESTNPERNDEDEINPIATEIVSSVFPKDTSDKQEFCDVHGGIDVVVKDVRKLLQRCCEVKGLPITCLNVCDFVKPQPATDEQIKQARQEYNDAIVNIFTRLNTAGRTLTREEITFAWVKRTWEDADAGGGTYKRAEEFVEKICDVFKCWEISADDAIRALSIIWCNHENGRRGRPLESKELLQADVIRKMARFLRPNADRLIDSAIEIQTIYERDQLIGISDSFNAVTIAWDLLFSGEVARLRIAEHMNEHEKDNKAKELQSAIGMFVARWAVLPSWGRKWANEAVAFLKQTMETMSDGAIRIADSASADVWRQTITDVSSELNQNAVDAAKRELEIRLWERKVSLYRSRLEIWQSLDVDRARFRNLTFMDANSKATPSLNVDHIIAHAYWEKRVSDAFADNSLDTKKALCLFVGMTEADADREMASDPARADQRAKAESVGFINSIGNCMILNAGYNIAKRTKQLSEFMDQMYEFKPDTPDAKRVDRKAWARVMLLSDELLNPALHSFEEIVAAVNRREKEVYSELRAFVDNRAVVLH